MIFKAILEVRSYNYWHEKLPVLDKCVNSTLELLFTLKLGDNILQRELSDCVDGEKNIPYISTTRENNGISGYSDKYNAENVITYGVRGSNFAFYQEGKINASSNVVILDLKVKELTKPIAIFLNTILMQEKRWTYGYNPTITHLSRIEIKLPVDMNGNVDWDNIESYINERCELNRRDVRQPASFKEIHLEERKWKKIKLKDILEIKKGFKFSISNIEEENGNYPIVSATIGYPEKYTNETKYLHTNECNLIINRTGSTGYCKFMNGPIVPTENVYTLNTERLTPLTSLFLYTLINSETYRYPYGRTCNQTRIEETEIPLPLNEEGEVDWDFIEIYMKSRLFTSKLNVTEEG